MAVDNPRSIRANLGNGTVIYVQLDLKLLVALRKLERLVLGMLVIHLSQFVRNKLRTRAGTSEGLACFPGALGRSLRA